MVVVVVVMVVVVLRKSTWLETRKMGEKTMTQTRPDGQVIGWMHCESDECKVQVVNSYNFPILCGAAHAVQHHSVTIHNHRAQIEPALRLKTTTDYFLPVLSVCKTGTGGGGGGRGCWSAEALGWGPGGGGRGWWWQEWEIFTLTACTNAQVTLLDRSKDFLIFFFFFNLVFCLPAL